MLASTFPGVLRLALTIAFLAVGASAAMAHPPWGIVVSSTGIVYFSDLETVWKIDRDGKKSVFRASVGGRHVHELSIDDEDNLYGTVEVYEARREKYLVGVWKMTPDGKETQLQHPIDIVMSGVSIWRDRAGNMYSIEQNNHIKERTLLLRRTPAGAISTLAGGAYGHSDGKGAAARFGSVGGLTIAPDGNIYLTDGTSVRKVTPDGTVTTIARNLEQFTNSEDSQGTSGLTGLSVDNSGNVYVADAGRRRLLKVKPDRKVEVVYRGEAPYFPNGVYATADGALYVLEAGLIPPSTNIPPRVRKISRDGKNVVLVTLGEQAAQTPFDHSAGSPGVDTASTIARFTLSRARILFVMGLLSAAGLTVLIWRRHSIQRA